MSLAKARYRSSAPTIVDTELSELQVDINGNLKVALASSTSDAVLTDDAAFTPGTSNVDVAGFLVDDTATDSVDEGDTGAARMSTDRILYTQGALANDAVDAGNPIKIGGKAFDPASPQSAVAANDRVNTMHDLNGRLIIYKGTVDAGEDLARNVLSTTFKGTGTRITTATTTTAKSGAGNLKRIFIEVVLSGTVTIYDNTAASGTILTILPIGLPAGSYELNIEFATGCTLVTSAGDRLVAVTGV